jgi:hypothetical protein
VANTILCGQWPKIYPLISQKMRGKNAGKGQQNSSETATVVHIFSLPVGWRAGVSMHAWRYLRPLRRL